MMNQQLLEYIKGELGRGVTEQDLREVLAGQGWAQNDVDEAFSMAKGEAPIVPVAPVSPQVSGNGKATAALVLGITGLIAWIMPLFGVPVTIIGLIFGVKGRGTSKKRRATVGLVLSIIGLVLAIANASIGAYMGAIGQHDLLNRLRGEDAETTETTETAETAELQRTVPSVLEPQPYRNTILGFQLRIPEGWLVDESGYLEYGVEFSPHPSEMGHGASVSTAVTFLGEEDRDLLITSLKELLRGPPVSAQLTDEQTIFMDGRDGYQIIYTYTAESGIPMHGSLVVITLSGRGSYLVAGEMSESLRSSYEDIITDSLMTFETLSEFELAIVPDLTALRERPYRNEELGFQIRIPQDWVLVEKAMEDGFINFLHRTVSSNNDVITPAFITVVIHDGKNRSIDEWAEHWESFWAGRLYDYQVEKDERVIVDGSEARLLTATYLAEGEDFRTRRWDLIIGEEDGIYYGAFAIVAEPLAARYGDVIPQSMMSFDLIP